MSQFLVVAGVACLMAAIVGGGLKAAQFEFPAITSVRRQALLCALGVVLIPLGLLVVNGDGDGNGNGTSPPPKASTPKLEKLLRHVPSAFRSTCRSVTRPRQAAPASVNCYPSFGASFIQYQQYSDAATMASDFNEAVELRLSPSEVEGDCSGGKGTEESEYGLLLCYFGGGNASLEWIDVRLIIYTWAKRGDADHEALLASWRQGAFGPNP